MVLFVSCLHTIRLANTVRRYIGIHNTHHIKTYVFKQSLSSSARIISAPTDRRLHGLQCLFIHAQTVLLPVQSISITPG